MNNINTDFWSAYTQTPTSGLNVRTGAADLTDPDFTDFPPCVTNDFSDGGINPYGVGARASLLVGMTYYSSQINTAADVDNSIAYCSCVNGDLFTTNVIAPTFPPSHEPNEIHPFKDVKGFTSDNGNFPIRFINYPAYMASNYNQQHSIGSFYNPYNTSEINNQKWYMFSPKGLNEGDFSNVTELRKCNTNTQFTYWRDFGIRVFFGVIKLFYYDGTLDGTTGTPSGVNDTAVSLHWYETQTDAWKASHPIVGAYLDIYRRSNVNGTYSNGRVSNNGFFVDIASNLKANAEMFGTSQKLTQWQPQANVKKNSNPFFPLFGHCQCGGRTQATPETFTRPILDSNAGTSQYSDMMIGYNCDRVMQGKASNSSYRNAFWFEIDGTPENLEKLRKSAAAYGMFFADDVYDLADSGRDETRWTDENMCLGVVDSRGFTDGTYTRGTGNTDANNFTWKTGSESNYSPDTPPPSPENRYDNQTVFNTIGDLATMTRRYVLRGSEVMQLGSALWSVSSAMSGSGSDYTDYIQKTIDQFLTNNPIDCIISLQRYPMTIPAVGTDTVKLGKTDTGIACKPMERTAFFYLFAGSVINPKFGDSFLDYNPYTKMELYVPFCGTMQLNPADIIGRQLNVQLVVDFTTGTATGFIMSDDLVIETVNGNIAIDIPVTGIQSATVASQLYNANANATNKMLERESSTTGLLSVGGISSMIRNPVKTFNTAEISQVEEARAEYDLHHQNAPIHVIGAASAVGGWAIDLQCRLIIYYPSGDVIRTGQPPEWNSQQLARYGHTTGFACCIEGSIGSMDTGLVVGIAPDLNGMVTNEQSYPATAAELDMLRAAISEGVIL